MATMSTLSRMTLAVFGASVAAVAACSGPAEKAASPAPQAAPAAQTVEQLEAAVRENPLKEAYFGETHVHTSFSLDAYIGGARLTPDEAYKFAQGKDVTIQGQTHNIRKPLDWTAVSDHAEFIGEMFSAQVPEDNYIGSHGPADGTLEMRREGEIDGWIKGKDSSPGSLSGVWATRNTRAAIWDAMAARETFVTSGTRIKVRFFASADLARPADPRALVELGYKSGVPMGGTITGTARSPTFTVWASKDPDGANLDRIQIVKGWVDAKGEPRDQVIDVVWSGDRKPGANGKLPRSGTRWTCRRPPTRTRSAAPSSSRRGPIPRSIRSSTPSTTCACSRSRRRASPPTTRCATTCRS
jgi:hypothetical protein